MRRNAPQRAATHCNMPQRNATRRNVPQRATTYRNRNVGQCWYIANFVASASTIVNAVVVDDVFLLTCSKAGTTSAGHAATSIRNMSVGMPS